MSPVLRTRRDGSTRPARYRAVQPLALLWLTLVWLALWGEVTPVLVIGGVLVAVLVCVMFPLPPIDLASGVRPLALAALVGRFAVDVVRASIQVSGVVLRRRPFRNAVVAVDLESSSDFVMTLVASMLSLVPGSVVVEARRSTHTLFLHVLDVPDRESAEAFRRDALDLEQRVLRALPPRPHKEVRA
ncbi:Na+/H+ antiporter subunit E [Nocardioides marmotae]|uniref:Na+/H+ antiporter subunit E n=1 Tax=Nocardioides marmotae TaxID=2663857 RepID=UPI0012B5B348|nr:Na+/H+ antiporter subunit E [Nocardioides marmotae]MBC9731622.1 Na+/H+ antiporter subunit E [Nocardioides marmotae]MTB82744.1 Na+/H+ antiporter subunit E [Nocardioides marmotae]